jgi:hypothetical protein
MELDFDEREFRVGFKFSIVQKCSIYKMTISTTCGANIFIICYNVNKMAAFECYRYALWYI